jgi:MarR family 2-MHQ and catechol resistance regulon transcriptional repressor
MTPKRPPIDGTFRTLIRTFGMARRVMEPYFAEFDLSGSQWGVLRALARAEEQGLDGLRLTDLGDRLLIRPPSVTGVVDRLHRLGLIERQRLATDQRARQIRLSPAGRKRVQRVLAGLGSQVETVLGGLDASERKQLQRLLDKLYAHLEQLPVTRAAVGPPHRAGRNGAGMET